jgi:thiol:disulfide interchange protein DsbD
MGQLFILIGLSSQWTKLLPRSGAWMESVKIFFGYLLTLACLYYLWLLMPLRWWDGITGLILVALGSAFGAFKPLSAESAVLSRLNKGFQQMLIFVGAAFVTVSVLNLRPWLSQQPGRDAVTQNVGAETLAWQPYSDALLKSAAQQHKPILIDFWADWCTACKELDALTFSQAEFQQEAAHFTLLKFDATNDSEMLGALRSRYSLIGLPTLLLFDAQGHWRKDLTSTEAIAAPALVEKMRKADH